MAFFIELTVSGKRKNDLAVVTIKGKEIDSPCRCATCGKTLGETVDGYALNWVPSGYTFIVYAACPEHLQTLCEVFEEVEKAHANTPLELRSLSMSIRQQVTRRIKQFGAQNHWFSKKAAKHRY